LLVLSIVTVTIGAPTVVRLAAAIFAAPTDELGNVTCVLPLVPPPQPLTMAATHMNTSTALPIL
jgi:hypothetical protein